MCKDNRWSYRQERTALWGQSTILLNLRAKWTIPQKLVMVQVQRLGEQAGAEQSMLALYGCQG